MLLLGMYVGELYVIILHKLELGKKKKQKKTPKHCSSDIEPV